jgi:hypothetical protein
MGQLVILKVNLSSVDKAHLFKGEKGIYLDLVARINDEPDQYGNHGMVTQGITKEHRAAGVKGAILGNAKVVGSIASKPTTMTRPSVSDDILNDLAF